jgi:DNA invertase Pin-like site-specific DNA recombinase
MIAYLRVSSAGQIDAWGLDRQKAAITTWTKANGHRIVGWHSDEGVSGTLGALQRPGMSQAIEAIGRTAEGLVVADLDRFARQLMVQEAALKVIWKAGGHVFTATGGEVQQDDPNDGARTLIRQVLGAVIQYEKHQAMKRMCAGRTAKAAAGRKATGSYPYGYEGRGKGRERDAAPRDDEQQAVVRIAELRRSGRSYRQIAMALDHEGLPPRRAESWSAMTVRNIAVREGVANQRPLRYR